MTARSVVGALRLIARAGVGARSRDVVGALTLRGVSGPYTGGGSFKFGETRRKSMLPNPDVPWFDSDLKPTAQFFRFVQYLWETKIGGDLAPTLPAVASNATAASSGVAFVTAQQTVLTQAVVTNGESLAATIGATQAAGAPGADQIPPPVLDVPDVDPTDFDPLDFKRQRPQ